MAFEIVDGMTGTKHISSSELAILNVATIGAWNCVLSYDSNFKLTMTDSNHATLGPGAGVAAGRRFLNKASTPLTIQSGTQGQNRNDIIAAEYKKTSAGIESVELVVIKGTPTTGTAADPNVSNDCVKLWRVPLRGITVSTPQRLFTPLTSLNNLATSGPNTVVLYNANGWYIAYKAGIVFAYAVNIHTGSGSWDMVYCPYVLPTQYRPYVNIYAPAITENGASWTGAMYVDIHGKIRMQNTGNAGSADNRSAAVSWPV